MKTTKQMALAGGAAMMAITGTMTPTVTMAQSYEEQMEIQSVLQDLDWQVQIREKQIEFERLTNELDAVKSGEDTEKNKTPVAENKQQRVFEYPQAGQQGAQGMQRPLTPEELAEQRKRQQEQQREIEIASAKGIVDQMRLIEIYAPKDSQELEAVVSTGNGLRTLKKGDQVMGWRVTDIEIQHIKFHHAGFGLDKSLRFIR